MGDIVAISGGFDPIMDGHIQLMQEVVRMNPDRIDIYVNTDQDLINKKGYVLQPLRLRLKLCFFTIMGILQAVSYNYSQQTIGNVHVNVTPVLDNDGTVRETLRQYRPTIFANGGDRSDESTIPERDICKELGIEMRFGVGGYTKLSSSSEAFHNARKQFEMYFRDKPV